MFRRLSLKLIVACTIAVSLTILWARGEQNFEYRATRTALWYEAKAACPLSDERKRAEDLGMLSICANFGLIGYDSAQRYRDIAPHIFVVYGEVPEFRAVLDTYGHHVIPVIQYFRERKSREFRIRADLSQILDALVNLRKVEGFPELTPDQHGLIAIHEIKRRGHALLAEFEISDGIGRKPITRALSTVIDVFAGGITELEAAIIRGDRPTWKQVGHAVLDATIILGGTSLVVKSLQVARHGALIAKAGNVMHAMGTVWRVAAITGATTVAIVVVTNPGLIASAVGQLAELAGLPSWAGVLLLSMVVAAMMVWVWNKLYRYLFAPFVVFPYRMGKRIVRHVRIRRERRLVMRAAR